MENPESAARIRVKFLARGASQRRTELWTRQMPAGSSAWGICRFLFNTEERNYDWLVVYDDLPPLENERFSCRKEKIACPVKNTLLITGEPSSIKLYGRDFLSQFGHVLTSQEPWAIPHPGAIFNQPSLRWYYGVGNNHIRTIDEMQANSPDAKNHLLSTVCSSKRQRHTLHRARFDFVQKLQTLLPCMDVFGHGVRPMDDKAEALDSYRYHIAIENHLCLHHWTEKLADSFLGMSLPFYYGCPNVTDYFPAESLIPINIHDAEGAARIIKKAIENEEYEKRLPAIREARRLVLERYNLFSAIERIVKERSTVGSPLLANGAPAYILARHQLRREKPLGMLRFAWDKLLFPIRRRICQKQPPL